MLTTCPSCAEEIHADAIRCKHCGHLLVNEGWLEDVRAYARMTPQERLDWMRHLSPDQGRRFRQVWKALGPQEEGEGARAAPPVPASSSASVPRPGTRNTTALALLVILGLILLLIIIGGEDTLVAGSGGCVLVLVALVYFVPSIVASSRKHHNLGSILVINLLLGWTFVGWVVALAMAASAVRPESTAGANRR